VVLAELAGGVAEWLEQFRNGRVFRGPADVHARHADFAHPGQVDALAADEGRPARGVTLLAKGVGESHAFVGDPVDVGCAIPDYAVAVAAQVANADVVAPMTRMLGLPFGMAGFSPIDVSVSLGAQRRWELGLTKH
jgi:hypothetical protein